MGIPDNQKYDAAPARKRKAQEATSSSASGKVVIDLTHGTPPKKRAKANNDPIEDRRLRRKRHHPPNTYLEIRNRALTQRMYVIDRHRSTAEAGYPIETVSLAGTTGNVYTIQIDQESKCDCPHARKGNQCKHIVYVLARVLRVPEELEYQLAHTPAELQSIFAHAPPLPFEQDDESAKDEKRRLLAGECPICCEDFEAEESGEEVVYCKATCGNNMHKGCFEKWAATKTGGAVTCPFCRTPWQGDDESLKRIASMGAVNEDGYVNVASQLGISGERDYSTYHRRWVQRNFGYDS